FSFFSCIPGALLVLALPPGILGSVTGEGLDMVQRGLFVLAAISSSIFLTSNLVGAEQKSALKSPGKWTPTHPYNINPEAGPWTICVISYTGDTAFTFSEDMVSEMRRDFKLPGYFYNRSEVERNDEFERQEALRKKRWEFYRQYGVQEPLK